MNVDRENHDGEPEGGEDIAALSILGVFLCILGGTMIIAAFWPPTLVGKLTNLLAAVLLLVIGAVMCLLGRSERRKDPPSQNHDASATGETKPF